MKQDFKEIFGSMLHVFFCNFLRSSGLNRAHSDMDEKISSPCSSQRTKLSLIVKTDDVTSGRGGGGGGSARVVMGGLRANGFKR